MASYVVTGGAGLLPRAGRSVRDVRLDAEARKPSKKPTPFPQAVACVGVRIQGIFPGDNAAR